MLINSILIILSKDQRKLLSKTMTEIISAFFSTNDVPRWQSQFTDYNLTNNCHAEKYASGAKIAKVSTAKLLTLELSFLCFYLDLMLLSCLSKYIISLQQVMIRSYEIFWFNSC